MGGQIKGRRVAKKGRALFEVDDGNVGFDSRPLQHELITIESVARWLNPCNIKNTKRRMKPGEDLWDGSINGTVEGPKRTDGKDLNGPTKRDYRRSLKDLFYLYTYTSS